MKKKLFLIILSAPLLTFAQNNFTLSGKVGTDGAPAKAFLLYRDGKRTVTDSVTLTGGSFKFTGTVQEPVPARLIIDHKGVGFAKTTASADMMMLYLAKEDIKISSPDSLKRAAFPGSAINAEYEKYKAHMAAVNLELESVYNSFRNATEAQKKDSAFRSDNQAKADSADRRFRMLQYSFIKSNPESYVSLSTLRDATRPVLEVAVIEPLFNSLSPKLRSSEAGRELMAMINERKALALGKYAPQFTQNDQFEKPVKLSDFKGKYVLIDFWASWCAPCRAENPNVVRAYKEFKDKGFTVLGVSLDRPGKKDDWIKAIQADGLEWTQVSDLKFWDNEVAKLYGIHSVPQNFLLDPSGKVIAENLRGEELQTKLREIL